MSFYSDTLKQVIADVIWQKEEKSIKSLFSLSNILPTGNKVSGMEDFELISFLIIK
jgi:hypothetical protein